MIEWLHNTYPWLYNGLAIYLAINAVAVVWLLIAFALEDLKGPSEKFGYNFQSGFSYVMLALTIIPMINIWFLGAMILGWIEDQKRKRSNGEPL